jgi:predicted RNase H-like HicB family nuclease
MLYFMKQSNSLKLNIPVSILKEGKTFVVFTSALDLSTCGKTRKEAEKRFDEAVDVFFEETMKRKTLEEALTELGWSKVKQQWVAPVMISNEMKSLDIAYA